MLSPLGSIYRRLTARRVAQVGERVSVPVICVGNINAGGTGKTPTVIAVAERLKNFGYQPHVVSRGYGGSISGPTLVIEGTHTASETGDEPLLLSAFLPTWVAKNRAAGAAAAIKAGADVLILDDGFQNPSLQKDVSIVVVDGARQFGNGCVIPAGPLREPLATGLARADVVLVIGDGPKLALPVPVLTTQGQLLPLQTGMSWENMRVFAFAGIGNPSKFFATLRAMGVDLQKAEPLDDHQPLTETLMKRLEAEAKGLVAQLVTTEKDAVRLPTAFRRKVLTVPVRLEIEDWSPIDDALKRSGIHLNKD